MVRTIFRKGAALVAGIATLLLYQATGYAAPYLPITCNFEEPSYQYHVQSSVLNTPTIRAYLYQGTNRFNPSNYFGRFCFGKNDNVADMVKVTGVVTTVTMPDGSANVVMDFPVATNQFSQPVEKWYSVVYLTNTTPGLFSFTRGWITIRKSPEINSSDSLPYSRAINGSLYGPFSGSFATWPFVVSNSVAGRITASDTSAWWTAAGGGITTLTASGGVVEVMGAGVSRVIGVTTAAVQRAATPLVTGLSNTQQLNVAAITGLTSTQQTHATWQGLIDVSQAVTRVMGVGMTSTQQVHATRLSGITTTQEAHTLQLAALDIESGGLTETQQTQQIWIGLSDVSQAVTRIMSAGLTSTQQTHNTWLGLIDPSQAVTRAMAAGAISTQQVHITQTVATAVHGMGSAAASNTAAFYHSSNPAGYVDGTITNTLGERVDVIATGKVGFASIGTIAPSNNADYVHASRTNEFLHAGNTNDFLTMLATAGFYTEGVIGQSPTIQINFGTGYSVGLKDAFGSALVSLTDLSSSVDNATGGLRGDIAANFVPFARTNSIGWFDPGPITGCYPIVKLFGTNTIENIYGASGQGHEWLGVGYVTNPTTCFVALTNLLISTTNAAAVFSMGIPSEHWLAINITNVGTVNSNFSLTIGVVPQ